MGEKIKTSFPFPAFSSSNLNRKLVCNVKCYYLIIIICTLGQVVINRFDWFCCPKNQLINYMAPPKKYLGHQEDPSTVFSSLFNLSFKCRLHNISTTFIGIKLDLRHFPVICLHLWFVTYGDSRFKKCLLKRSTRQEAKERFWGTPNPLPVADLPMYRDICRQ